MKSKISTWHSHLKCLQLNTCDVYFLRSKKYYVTLSVMFYYVYILESCKDGSLYIGFSTDLVKRVKMHNKGENKSTKNKAPHRLIYYEAFLNKKDALGREKYLKSGFGRRSIQKMVHNYLSSS